MQVSHPSDAPKGQWIAEIRPGNYKRTGGGARLAQNIDGAPDNYRFSYSAGGGEGERFVPRHRHNFEQIRHPLDTGYSIGKDLEIPPGWVGYFPESAYYGPQHTKPGRVVILQFGGPSGIGYQTVAQHERAYEELIAKGGRFDDGIYTWNDEQGRKHNRDAYEALWEQVFGRPVEYPEPRYSDIILMNPSTFGWVKSRDLPGVAHKWLGSFTERNIRIGFIHLDTGATIPFGTENSNELIFLEQGCVATGEEIHPTNSLFGSSSSDGAETIRACEESLLYYVKLPTFA
jgi:hypothetical protein